LNAAKLGLDWSDERKHLALEVVVMKRSKCSLVAIAMALVCLLHTVSSQAATEDEWTFRDLARRYFAQSDAKELGKLVGLSGEVKHVVAMDYTVLLLKEGKEQAVDPKEYRFKVGDQIRIKIQPMNDAYVYIFHEGASGERFCLLPTEQEKVPLLKAAVPLVLPEDGYFEFVTPPGDEKLLVVATERPIADLALLSSVVFKKPGETLTAEEQAIKDTFKATVNKTLKSIRDRHNANMTFRGLPSKADREKFAEGVRQSGATQVVIEEPPHGNTTGTLALVASTDEAPNLFVTIPLVSVGSASQAP
jgi:hypothetical protein